MQDPQTALDWYRRGADLGDDDSLFKVGIMLARGEVGPPTADAFAETSTWAMPTESTMRTYSQRR